MNFQITVELDVGCHDGVSVKPTETNQKYHYRNPESQWALESVTRSPSVMIYNPGLEQRLVKSEIDLISDISVITTRYVTQASIIKHFISYQCQLFIIRETWKYSIVESTLWGGQGSNWVLQIEPKGNTGKKYKICKLWLEKLWKMREQCLAGWQDVII